MPAIARTLMFEDLGDRNRSEFEIQARPRLSASDLVRLNDIERRAAELFPRGRIPDPGHTLSPRQLRQSAEAGLLLVAADGDQLVGFAAGQQTSDWLHLLEVSVDPAWARRGMGRGLVERMVAVSARLGLAGTALTTFADLPWNGPFYQKLGFRPLEPAEQPGWLAATLVAEQSQGLRRRIAMALTHKR